MYVFDQTGVVDSAKLIEYITTEFPGEFKRLIEARDELAKRQGALSAVEKANKDREKAASTLAAAEAKASALLADAQTEALLAQTKLDVLIVREKTLADKEAEFGVQIRAKETELAEKAAVLAARETALYETSIRNDQRAAMLDVSEAALANRIKAFQDKVAALSA